MDDVKIENADLRIKIDYDIAFKYLAQECVKDIKNNCKGKGWSDDYVNGFTCKQVHTRNGLEYKVYNAGKEWRLAHLIENGHLIVNKKGGIGWSPPRPHIKPAYQKALKELEEVVKPRLQIKWGGKD